MHDSTLDDWKVNFCVWYNYVNQILIYTKSRSYPVEKYKEIIIHTPIPTIDVVKWGVDKSQHIYDSPDHLNDKINNFDRLDVDFMLFENRTDYLTDCMRRSIQFCFEKGFTINGVKIKIKK